jgi:dipeptidyl aminopeptidase/acylaminoacyl peptidase
MSILRAFAAGLLGGLLSTAVASARPITAEDLTRLQIPGGAVISHDGRTVAFTVTRLDAQANLYRRNIWLVATSGGGARQLTRGDADSDPQWSPDDRTIVFTSGRAHSEQIYRIAVDGGEAERLTEAKHGASSPRISHDGQRVAFLRVEVDPPANAHVDWHALGFTPNAKQRTSDLRRIDILHFEDNGRGEDFSEHAQLVVMRLDGGEQKQLTQGRFSQSDPAWAPDDHTLMYDSARRPGNDIDRNDIYAVPSTGGPERRLPLPHRSQTVPVFTHDGRLAYFMASKNDPAGSYGVQIAQADGTRDTTVVPEDTAVMSDAILADLKEGGAGCGPLFSADDRWFVADVSTPGATELRRFDALDGQSAPIFPSAGEIADCTLDAAAKTLAYTYDDATHLPEIYVADVAAGTQHRLTGLNDGFVRDVSLAAPEPLRVRDRAGFAVQAWIVKPPGATPGKRYPTLLEIHGGPETEFGNAFFHEVQFLAAQGYNVVYADPRGSVGFGYAFEAALSKNWGDPMFDDEMAVMDAVTARPDVDTHRLGVLGGSYGGYATLWVVSHTDRFRAAIAERVCSDLVSLFFASDFSSIPDPRYSWGAPWDDPLTYRKQSPFTYVTAVHTPLLLIHSDSDIRTPVDQTYEEYTALKALGKDVSLVEFPRENHDLSRTGEPLHRIERLHLLADYFARRLR